MSAWPFVAFESAEGRRLPVGDVSLYTVVRGSGRPLVFLHGLGWTHALWRRQLERYGERYRVVAADSRGHGASDKPTAKYSIRDMAEDWLRLLETLEAREWCLVGFSQGGMIAQWIAALEPRRTKALVVMGSSCRTNPTTQAAMEERLAAAQKSTRAAAELAAASVFSSAFAAREKDFVARFIEERAALELAPLAAATRALYDFDVTSELPRIACPTLVVAAAEDRLVPPSASAEIAGAIPKAQLERIEAAGHLSIIEEPQAVDRLLDRFLAEHYPGTENP